MGAAVRIERAEQAVRRNHLAQCAQRRGGAFLLDQNHRIDIARRIIERHDQVHRRPAFDPDVARAVLMQHHARQRAPLPLLTMGAAAARRLHQVGSVQMELGHRVAELVAVPLRQLLVKMLHREIRILVAVKPQHPLQLFLRCPPRRSPAHSPIGKPGFALILVTRCPALERAYMHPQHLSRLLLRDLSALVPVQQTRKTHPTHTLVYRCRAHRAPFVPGTTNTTLHELQTGDRSRANYISRRSPSIGIEKPVDSDIRGKERRLGVSRPPIRRLCE